MSDSEQEEKNGNKVDENLRQKLEGLVPEVIRRGLGAVFTSEEGIRKLANDISLPKDMAGFLIQQAQTTKDELFRIVAGELRGFLESLNLNEELQRLLTSLSFEVKTEIRFIPNDAKLVKPQIKNKVKVKRHKTEDDEEGQADDREEEAEEVESEES